MANQFRFLLHAEAYWLMDTLRRKLIEVGSGRMQLDTLRISLIKIGGRVREQMTKVRLHLAIRDKVYGTHFRELLPEN